MTTDEHLLTIFSEECAELIVELSKVKRFGRYEKFTESHATNHMRAQLELNDVLAMAWRCGFDIKLHTQLRDEKMAKVDKYMVYAESLGTVVKSQKEKQ